MFAHRFQEAIAQLRKATELEPSSAFAENMLGEALVLTGQIDEAIRHLEHAYETSKDVPTQDVPSLSFLGWGHGVKGERDQALQVLAQLQEMERLGTPVGAFVYAWIYVGLGQKERAIDFLEESWRKKETGPITVIKVDPIFDPLRGNSRFEELVNQILPSASK